MKIRPEYMKELRKSIKRGKRDARNGKRNDEFNQVALAVIHTDLDDTQVRGIGYAYTQAYAKACA